MVEKDILNILRLIRRHWAFPLFVIVAALLLPGYNVPTLYRIPSGAKLTVIIGKLKPFLVS